MAHTHRLLIPVLGIALATSGCGGKQLPEAPGPVAEAPIPAPAPTPAPAPVPVEPADPAPDTRLNTLEERIHFALDRSDLSPAARTQLEAKVEILRSVPGLTLGINGHADERGSDEYNLALSKRRAAEARRFLVEQGIEGARLETVGYGEEQPIDRTSSEAAYAMNRRADFRVTGGAISQR